MEGRREEQAGRSDKKRVKVNPDREQLVITRPENQQEEPVPGSPSPYQKEELVP